MKILYHHRIASKDGQYVHVSEIIRALESQGHEVLVVAPPMTEESDFGHDGGLVTKLKQWLPMAVYELLELGYSAVVALRLYKAIKSFKPDVIYERYNLYQPAGVTLSKVMGVPLLLEVNAPLQEERARFGKGLAFPSLARYIENYTWKKADMTLPVTNVLAEKMRERGVSNEKIKVIHNGIRDELLKSKELKPLNDNEKTITIGFVGFMHLTCGVDTVIKALGEDKSFSSRVKLICVGEENDSVKKMKADVVGFGLEDKVTFTGLVSRDEVMNYVSDFDIAILPDVTEYASPLKMFEYMVEKCAVVAPDSDNIKEIFRPYLDGVMLFESGNKEHFVDCLKTLSNDPDLLRKCQLTSFDALKSNEFTWEANAERIVLLSESLIGQ